MKEEDTEIIMKLEGYLGSIAVHADEMLSNKGDSFDLITLESAIQDPELQEWIKQMTKLALLPVKRNI